MEQSANESAPEPSNASEVEKAAGFGLIAQGAIVGLVSLPLLLFGAGILGLIAAAGLAWAGQVLASRTAINARTASVVAVIAGGATAVISFFVAVLLSCASFMNCGSNFSILPFVLSSALMAFNLFCAVLLWRRSSG